MRKMSLVAFALCALTLGLVGEAAAASCWNHNGSIMRLETFGNQLTISYARPRQGIRNVGVTPGTVLITARDTGRITGTARVFSRGCAPLEYSVSGGYEGDYEIYLTGQRQVFRNCQPTGRYTTDELVFSYVGDQGC